MDHAAGGHRCSRCKCCAAARLPAPSPPQEEAAALGKSSFAFAFYMDRQKEERERGVTISCTTKEFFTDQFHYTIIDAPGAWRATSGAGCRAPCRQRQRRCTARWKQRCDRNAGSSDVSNSCGDETRGRPASRPMSPNCCACLLPPALPLTPCLLPPLLFSRPSRFHQEHDFRCRPGRRVPADGARRR